MKMFLKKKKKHQALVIEMLLATVGVIASGHDNENN